MKYTFLLFLIAAFSFVGHGQTKAKEVDLQVNGIRVGSTYKDTLKRLGKPIRESVDPQKNECTGGYSRTLYYDGLEVELDGDKSGKDASVISIDVTSSKWKLSSGIKLGATMEEIKALFGEPAAGQDGDQNRWVYGMSEKLGPGATDFLFKDGKLVSIAALGTVC